MDKANEDLKPHRKGVSKSKRGKHEGGIERKKRDYRGEKADSNRRYPRKPPNKNWRGPWPPVRGGVTPLVIPLPPEIIELMIIPNHNIYSEVDGVI